MKNNNVSKQVKTWCVCAGLLISGAANAIYLPPPATTISGVPLAHQYDDGYSYSTRVLDYFYPTMDYTGTGTGTGNLDILITTRSSGASNPTGFAAPVVNPQTSPVSGTWSVSVSTLATYLWEKFQSYVPVFTFDQSEPGADKLKDLLVSAKVEIFNSTGGLVEDWSFDNFKDGVYDSGNPATAPGTICIPDVLNDPTNQKCFDNNLGGGQFDFLVLVQDLDLSKYNDTGNMFKISWEFDNVSGGGEEITLTGLTSRNDVPEPSLLALLGLSFMALAATRRRRNV